VNISLMRDRLERFAALAHEWSEGERNDARAGQVLDELTMSAPLVETILDMTGEPYSTATYQRAYVDYRRPCLRAMGRLEDLEIFESLKPQGPKLDAVEFHPWVWEGALSQPLRGAG
jgi:hypothetical protein